MYSLCDVYFFQILVQIFANIQVVLVNDDDDENRDNDVDGIMVATEQYKHSIYQVDEYRHQIVNQPVVKEY
jgi:carbamoylphosphate synthase small subunit